jgi:molybdopterin-guanine dinucleotide biosynthesis protein A
MLASGFVLAGGRSSRMGRDKALLPYRGTTLLKYVAGVVEEVVGNVAIIGNSTRYAHLGYPVYPDKLADLGPLGGIYTALCVSEVEWNLIVACDMPALTVPLLRSLLERAEKTALDCVVATGPEEEAEPLCAVYHRRCLPVLAQAMIQKRLKMKDIVAEIGAEGVAVDALALANVNTPSDWAAENL